MPVYNFCDDDALPALSAKASSLTPNQFHKLCPGTHVTFGDGSSSSSTRYAPLGQPRCGDGTNFSFFVSRPLQQLSNNDKILIEFQGGGACWDKDTCGMQQDMLTFPEYYNNFVGMSCSEIEYGMSKQGDVPLSMLCAKKIGDTDFREYTAIVVPYCTQDIHLGDNPNASYDGGESYIHQVGAHNMYRTLEWVYKNFPNPRHIFLTGCSAGGTAVPIAYDLLNKHYNTFLKGGGGPLPRAVNINVIMDSSVYLTPTYFLENSFQNWNPGTIMKKIGFNYEKYGHHDDYADIVWHHILRRGSSSDRWGFVTHTYDPISLMFYQYMSGNGNSNRGRLLSLVDAKQEENASHPSAFVDTHNIHRKLDNDDNSQWWSEINDSMTFIQMKHKNVNVFEIDGEGHCSFGLYYPLLESGFEEWAGPIVKEDRIIGNRRPSVASFFTSFAVGGAFFMIIRRASQFNHARNSQVSTLEDNATNLHFGDSVASHSGRFPNDELMEENATTPHSGDSVTSHAGRLSIGLLIKKIQEKISSSAIKYQSWPWTAGYIITLSFYFLCMIILQGFTHPLDNPTLGPSAVGLSLFGINNPTLVIFQMEHFRLITASFLCSGILPYLLTAFSMHKHGAALEESLSENNHPYWHFLLVLGILSTGINLVYACLGDGASCSGLALALGLNAFSAILQRRKMASDSLVARYPSPWCFTLLVFILASTPIFPFDSLVALIAALVIGVIMAFVLFADDPKRLHGSQDDLYHNKSFAEERVMKTPPPIQWNFVTSIGSVYLIMYIMVLLRIPSPDQNYLHPYLTGCGLVYSDQIGDFVNAYANTVGGGRGRFLEENGDDWLSTDNLCAQICVPRIMYRPALWGVRKFASIPFEQGSCERNGYAEHVADKTFREFTITLEVQLFTASNYEN